MLLSSFESEKPIVLYISHSKSCRCKIIVQHLICEIISCVLMFLIQVIVVVTKQRFKTATVTVLSFSKIATSTWSGKICKLIARILKCQQPRQTGSNWFWLLTEGGHNNCTSLPPMCLIYFVFHFLLFTFF